ncbi:LamG-like jellyroll fold domain-containing protein [Planosporangium sp. 12N6]|uniref:LamG-like jellyroll fold domain-containing protein n=1 Tax=Planosporangium spinosum TaxID=3402278 RepID=UPI003CF558D5
MRRRRIRHEDNGVRGRRPWASLVAVGALVLASVAVPAGGAGAAPAPPERHGLRGDYFVSAPGTYGQFTTLKATVVDAGIDFADLEPALDSLTGQHDNVTVRWTGQIQPRYSEPYTFSMVGDNGFRLWVDNQPVIDHWVDDWDRPQTGSPVALQAGHRYDLTVEFFEHIGGSHLHLSWSSPSQPTEIVPNSALYLPPGFDYPGPLSATVSRDGGSVAMTFDQPVRRVPAAATGHVTLSVNGTGWPVRSVARDPKNAATVLLRLAEPVPRQAGNTIRVAYDGQGGITGGGGAGVAAFHTYALNDSAHQLTTPWAKDVSAANALPEYPRPQLTRAAWRNLNGTWQYQAGTATQAPPTGDLSGKILVPYPPESLLSGVQRHDDHMWYRRTFTVPPAWRIGDQRLLLHFGAVDYQATVWVNGVQVATHTGGYSGFDVDVTDALTGTGPQTLLVKAVDPGTSGPDNQPVGKQRSDPSGIWYTPSSGIWQTVWMEPVPTAHIDRLDLTPDLTDNTLELTVRAAGVTGEKVEATAWDGDTVVGSVTGPVGAALALPVPHPKLWSPDRPFLYDLKVRLVDGRRTVDAVGSYFGMRSVSVGDSGGQPHMLLNGTFVYHLGTLDQGFWPDGLYTAPTDAALKFDLQQQKALGFNTVRKHIKVEPERWYYWADKLGLLVWQDMPAMNPDRGTPLTAADRAEFEAELHTMIDQHRSHPAITMWVPFNEGWGEYDPARIANQVKTWDPSRLVNADSGQNCCASLPDPHAGDIYDNHNYPEPGHPVPTDHRAVVDGEFGGLGLKVPGHMWFGGGFAYEMTDTATRLTDRYVQLSKDLESCVRCGLSGSIYTQPYDVEGEINGLMTYDRRVLKVDAGRVRAANAAVLAAAGTVANPPPPPPGTPGLTGVGYWPLDQVTGGTTPDASGRGHDGTLVNGPAPVAGRDGDALRFNGTDQWVDSGASILDTTGDYSVSAWVRIDSPGGAFATAVSQDSDGGSSAFFLQYSGADHRFAFSAVGVRALAPTAPEPGRWYHLVGVRDAPHNQLRLYVDGGLAGTVAHCPGVAAGGHTVIGRAQYQGRQVDFWGGALDQVHVFDRALSAAEIATLYASGA